MSRNRRPGPTQAERVIALLRARAVAGRPINTTELLAPTVDGLPPIVRLAARINELRDAGFTIDTIRSPNGTADYYLRSEPAIPEPAPVDPAQLEEHGRLFATTDLCPQDKFAQVPSREAA